MVQMLESMKNDIFVSFLVERCSLTRVQLDTILASQTDGNLKRKLSHRDKRKLSPGAFIRTLRQGQRNIEACMYTLILLEYLGLVKPEGLERLSRLGTLISKLRESNPTTQEIGRVILAIQESAEGLSQRRRFIV
jgi:hypothetical protein